MIVVVGVPELDVADALEGEGAEWGEANAEGFSDELCERTSVTTIWVGLTCGLGAGGGVDVGAVPAVFEELGRADVDANAEFERA